MVKLNKYNMLLILIVLIGFSYIYFSQEAFVDNNTLVNYAFMPFLLGSATRVGHTATKISGKYAAALNGIPNVNIDLGTDVYRMNKEIWGYTMDKKNIMFLSVGTYFVLTKYGNKYYVIPYIKQYANPASSYPIETKFSANLPLK